MKSLDVLNQNGEVVDKVTLDVDIFDGKVNQSLIRQAVVIYLVNQRKGLASTKTKGEVRGGGRKPWRQKGTGRARVGSNRSPLWRGGGIIFGPKPKDYYKNLSKKMRTGALKSALNAKLNDEEIVIVENMNLQTCKTKDFVNTLKRLKLDTDKIKIVVCGIDENLKMCSRNLRKVKLEDAEHLTTYTALDCKKIVFTQDGLKKVEDRIKKG